jgi:putative sterol carrier protein
MANLTVDEAAKANYIRVTTGSDDAGDLAQLLTGSVGAIANMNAVVTGDLETTGSMTTAQVLAVLNAIVTDVNSIKSALRSAGILG